MKSTLKINPPLYLTIARNSSMSIEFLTGYMLPIISKNFAYDIPSFKLELHYRCLLE